MKILTWNINGIRACKIPLDELFRNLDSDIICLQETKITRDQLDNDIVNVENYNAYFSFSKKRSGYSGVATYCRKDHTPVAAEEGITGLLSSGIKQTTTVVGCYGDQSSFSGEELQSLDAEGRTIITQHKYRNRDGALCDLVIINVYCPRADPDNPERVNFKLRFYRVLQLRAEALVRDGKSVIIVGDVNASHRRVDHCDPSDERGRFEDHPSRRWLDGFIKDVHLPQNMVDESPSSSSQGHQSSEDELSSQGELASQEDQHSVEDTLSSCKNVDRDNERRDESLQEDHFDDEEVVEASATVRGKRLFVDTFRCFHPKRKNAFTCWNTMTSARETNYGTRIDYILADERLCVEEFVECDIMPEVHGSDHCPVKATLGGVCQPSEQLPPLCAKFMPEFAGKQKKLSSFFQKVSPSKAFEIHEKTFSTVGQRKTHGLVSSTATKRSGQPLAGKPTKKTKTSTTSVKMGNIASFFQKKSVTTNSKPFLPHEQSLQKDSLASTGSCDMTNSQSRNIFVASIDYEPQSSLSQETISQDQSQESSHSTSASIRSEAPVDECNSSSSSTSTLQDSISVPSSGEDSQSKPKPKSQLNSQWRNILKGPPPPPKCRGHKEPCVLRTVKKVGPNLGRQFFVCRRGDGHKDNPEARCNHFEWVPKR